MSEKPGKRMVGWEQYLGTQCAKGATNAAGAALLIVGSILLVPLIILWIGEFRIENFLLSVLFGVLGFGIILTGKKIVHSADRIEPVVLLTKHNTGDIPEAEILVRASALPPSHQQAELLRAALGSNETPEEELLRAGGN